MFASTNSIVPDTTGSSVSEESEKTRATYTSILSEFRHLLRAEGLDLDAADPRQARSRWRHWAHVSLMQRSSWRSSIRCKGIVEQHRSEIGLRSTPGGGTIFWLALPVAPLDK